MGPKLHVLIQAIILSVNSRYVTSNCGKEPFGCGIIPYIKHPFWLGGSGGVECGLQSFQIICNDGIPLLNISSLTYRLLQLDFPSNTLRVARQDLHNNACPQILRNTTIDLQHFRFPAKSTDRNLTLYLNCTGDDLQSSLNKVSCDATVNLFETGGATSGPGAGVRCKNVIFVPINREAALSLEKPTASSINNLLSALSSGFSIQWLNQTRHRHSKPSFHHGLPPVQSPAHPPHSRSYHRQPGNGKNPGKEIAIVVAITVTVVIPLSIAIRCSLKRRQPAKTPNSERKQDVENFLLQHGSLTPKRFTHSEIKKMTKSLTHKLGQGGYGSVYRGTLPDGCPVAVKVLIETDSDGEEFINEVASISRTSHVNIVALLGFCYERNRRALVYEYMPNKSLDKFLNRDETESCRLDLDKLYKIAVGTARGLEYLHTGCATRIIHFDIKPQNILLDHDLCPKISDFGLAKLCKKKQSVLSVTGTRGTIGYIAPEVFSRNFGGVSHKSDVYSYGMMLLEMAGARKLGEAPVMVIQSSEDYFPDKIYQQVISDDGLMMEETRRKMFLVGFWRIQTIPSNRPSISRVVDMLEGSIGSIKIPPKPFLCSPDLPRHEVPSSSLSAYLETENFVS